MKRALETKELENSQLRRELVVLSEKLHAAEVKSLEKKKNLKQLYNILTEKGSYHL